MNLAFPSRWDEASRVIFPVMRRAQAPANWLSASKRGPEYGLVRVRVTPHLHRILMVETDLARVYLQQRRLAQWGIDLATAWSTADYNLAAFAHQGLSLDNHGFWSIHGPWSTGCIGLKGWLDTFAAKVQGKPILFIPEEDQVWITGSQSHDQIGVLIGRVMDRFREAPRPISPAAYTINQTGILVPYLPRSGPHSGRLRTAFKVLQAFEYGEQAESIHDGLTDGTVIASVAVRRHLLTGEGITTARLHESTETLLPVVQVVQLLHPNGRELFLPWSVVQQQIEMAPMPDLYPPRYRVPPRQFNWSALGKEAIQLPI